MVAGSRPTGFQPVTHPTPNTLSANTLASFIIWILFLSKGIPNEISPFSAELVTDAKTESTC